MFLDALIQRTFGEAATLTPRRASRFEPTVPVSEPPVDAAPEPSAPRLRSEPPPPALPPRAPPAERSETRIVERVSEPRETRIEPFQVVTEKSVAVPVPGQVSAPPVVVGGIGEQPPAGGQEPSPAPRASFPHEPVSMVPAEPSRETVIRERVESRLETRTLERRLESLTRERHVEHTERPGPPVSALGEQPRQPVIQQAPPAEPRRPVVMPEVKRTAPESLVRRDAAPPPATPVVHVTIGRVEIKAAAPAPARQAPPGREPKLGLEEYLRRREKP